MADTEEELLRDDQARQAEMREYAAWLAGMLRGVERDGAPVDEPEGARYLTLSDTLANEIAATIMRLLSHE